LIQIKEQIAAALKSPAVRKVWRDIQSESGNCFAAAFWVAMAAKQAGYEPVVVHGSPTLARPPYDKYAHAWVEVSVPLRQMFGPAVVGFEDEGFPILGFAGAQFPIVIDYSNGLSAVLPASAYYNIGKIEERACKRYSIADLVKRAARTEHYGPYHRNSGRTL